MTQQVPESWSFSTPKTPKNIERKVPDNVSRMALAMVDENGECHPFKNDRGQTVIQFSFRRLREDLVLGDHTFPAGDLDPRDIKSMAVLQVLREDPSEPDGLKLLGIELAHAEQFVDYVDQKTGKRVRGPRRGGAMSQIRGNILKDGDVQYFDPSHANYQVLNALCKASAFVNPEPEPAETDQESTDEVPEDVLEGVPA